MWPLLINYMSKTWKIILGVLSFSPILYLGVFTQYIIPTLMRQGTAWPYFWELVATHLTMMVLCFFLFIYYLVKVVNNQELGENKTMWILGLIFLNGVAWPVYWYFNIWKKVK